jgi:hypothetical protein
MGVRLKPLGEDVLPIGPLKTERFLRAKTGRPGEAGPKPPPPSVFFASWNPGRVPRLEGSGRRETRMPEGKVPFVGVAGNILTEACGERGIREPEAILTPDGLAMLALEVDDALDRLCAGPAG